MDTREGTHGLSLSKVRIISRKYQNVISQGKEIYMTK